ncbi:hypothetical protein GCM10010918_15720 [Paenibacillus radicis (ex Gao et al. 2016)]|uniref:CoF synthetase n=2 Tax=Paenibacillus radicis (ex Gao et al. 2016) TaxID=1737354 RepID=A0A917GZ62_9BACL|nr:hypothetical protein GCM10010918_15720 [Paenibacillus radicis (ex Gao et al. 2016)]
MYPWYAKLAQASEPAEWEDVPLLTAERLNDYYNRGDGANDPEWNVYRTSGTSGGRRKAIYYDAIDETFYVMQKVALFGKLLAGTDGIERVLSDMGTGHAEATAKHIFEQLGYECESVPFGLPAAVHLVRIQQFQPDVLYTMPSLLDGLFRAAPVQFAWGLKKIILVGEPAPPEWRRRVAERLGIAASDIIDTYGSIEIGTIAYYDAAMDRYVLLEGLLAEGVSPGEIGLPDIGLPEGEQVLALTSFQRRRFPALRYVTYDVVRDLRTEVSENGETLITFEAIVKRIGPELKHGEKISVYDVENAVFKHIGQAEVRVQVSGNRLQVQIATVDEVDEETAAAVRAELQGAIPEIGAMIRGGLLEEMKVEFIPAGSEAGWGGVPAAEQRILVTTPAPVPVKRKKLYLSDESDKGKGNRIDRSGSQ